MHEAGLLHRDVKAQNVMRETGGRVVLMDFGTVHDLERLPSRDGDLSGTPLYLAPEIFAGGAPGVASDIYALAVLYFFLLTGRHPVSGQTLEDVRAGHLARQRMRLRDARPGVPEALAEAIERGLEADPTARHPTAHTFAAALERAQLASVERDPTGAPRRKPRRAMTSAVGAVVVAIGAVIWTIEIGNRPSRPGAPELRKVNVPRFQAMGGPSRDGRFLSYIDANGDVSIWEVKTGGSRRLTDAGQSGEAGLTPLVSPKGDLVAYGWSLPDESHELRLRDADGSLAPRVLIARETAYQPIPMDWSRDGREILCLLLQKNGSSDLVLVSLDGGQRLLYTSTSPEAASLSPDNRFVVTYRPGAAPGTRELIILSTQSPVPDPRVLLTGPSADRYAMWSDREHVFFIRDEPVPAGSHAAPSSEGWVLAVVDGVTRGEATKVTKGLGHPATPTEVTVTDDGAVYQIVSLASKDVYTTEIDLAGLSIPGAPTRISPTKIGDHVAPAWSPDGRFIAYLTTGPAMPNFSPPRTLTIHDVSSGATRELPTGVTIGGYSPRWSPDSESVVVWRQGPKGSGYFRVNLSTNQTMAIEVDGQKDALPDFQCSPTAGGHDFYYADEARGIVARDLSTGRERIVVPKGSWSMVWPFAVAPDGQSIAFVGTSGPQQTLEVQAFGGTPRELARAQSPEFLSLQTWTPDSQDLILAQSSGTRPRPLWRISARGGSRRDMHFAISGDGINPISFKPDGTRMVYPERTVQYELWIRRPGPDGTLGGG